MAGSRPPGIIQKDPSSSKLPQRTPGPLGQNDAADPNARTLPGDTPGPLGTYGGAVSPNLSPTPLKPLRRGYAGAVLIDQRPDLFFNPKESVTFTKLLAEAKAMSVKIAPNDDMKADDAATYDPQYNVILLSVADFANKDVKRKGELHQSTAHELAHAVQNKPILENAADPEGRAKLLDQAILQWKTEDAYVAYHLKKEIIAEAIAQRCNAETLDYFDRTRGQRGFDKNMIEFVVQERVKEFAEQNRSAYEKRARELWRRASTRLPAR